MMQFNSQHSSKPREYCTKYVYRGLNLCDSNLDFSRNSLELLYEVYCRWESAKQNFLMVPIELIITDGNSMCDETLLEILFCVIENEVADRTLEELKKIELVCKKDNSIHDNNIRYQCYLFVSADAFQYAFNASNDIKSLELEATKVINGCITCIEEDFNNVKGSINFSEGAGFLSFFPTQNDGDVKNQSNFSMLSHLALIKSEGFVSPLLRLWSEANLLCTAKSVKADIRFGNKSNRITPRD